MFLRVGLKTDMALSSVWTLLSDVTWDETSMEHCWYNWHFVQIACDHSLYRTVLVVVKTLHHMWNSERNF
jgi:hypothetical protein